MTIIGIDFTMNKLSAAFAILVFLGLVIYKYIKKEEILLSDIVIGVIAGGMLPLAIGFAIYPFFPAFIGAVENMSLQITLTGLVLIFVYTKTIFERINSS